MIHRLGRSEQALVMVCMNHHAVRKITIFRKKLVLKVTFQTWTNILLPIIFSSLSCRKKPPDHKSRPISDFSLMEENLFGEDVAFADEYKETDVVFKYEKEGTFV